MKNEVFVAVNNSCKKGGVIKKVIYRKQKCHFIDGKIENWLERETKYMCMSTCLCICQQKRQKLLMVVSTKYQFYDILRLRNMLHEKDHPEIQNEFRRKNNFYQVELNKSYSTNLNHQAALL